MTKWNLPEGRKPLTDEDMAALTRRLADTAIEHSELYQAAKRDAAGAGMTNSIYHPRLRKIALSLEHASEITIQRVEAELGLGPRRESPDAGKPWRFDESGFYGENNGPLPPMEGEG